MRVRELPDRSWVRDRLPVSCVMCQQGSKMVLLVTGLCGHGCWYCPLSAKKKGKDTAYADEMPVGKDSDVIAEARSIGARGTGITGGDPLLAMPRTLRYIRLLRKEFGEGHNIHLYTATPDIVKVRKLARAGLDEIRFHPHPDVWDSLEGTEYPGAIKAARACGLRTGIEVPAIPGAERAIAGMLGAAERAGAQFANLNELEFSVPNIPALLARGYRAKDDESSAVMGSEGTARRVLKLRWGGMAVHYCSSGFKDATQLRNRLLRRAGNTATGLEIITEDGTFVKGVIEAKDPAGLVGTLRDRFGIPRGLIRHDAERGRVEIAAWVLEELADEMPDRAFIVEEYPTWDRLEVERRPLAPR